MDLQCKDIYIIFIIKRFRNYTHMMMSSKIFKFLSCLREITINLLNFYQENSFILSKKIRGYLYLLYIEKHIAIN